MITKVQNYNNQPSFGISKIKRETFNLLPDEYRETFTVMVNKTESFLRRQSKGIDATLWIQKYKPQVTLTMKTLPEKDLLKKGKPFIKSVSPVCPPENINELKKLIKEQIDDFKFFYDGGINKINLSLVLFQLRLIISNELRDFKRGLFPSNFQ